MGQRLRNRGLQSLLKFAFEETPLNEVVAVVDSQNTTSRNVVEKSAWPLKACAAPMRSNAWAFGSPASSGWKEIKEPPDVAFRPFSNAQIAMLFPNRMATLGYSRTSVG